LRRYAKENMREITEEEAELLFSLFENAEVARGQVTLDLVRSV